MPYNPNDDLHGNVPDQSDVCLLIIDMINPFTFEAEEILPAASAAGGKNCGLEVAREGNRAAGDLRQ
ncbi:MAG TPA: hypothetical protein VGJ57_03745 [Nitrospirales bacterium]|jgi:hypothetical protein